MITYFKEGQIAKSSSTTPRGNVSLLLNLHKLQICKHSDRQHEGYFENRQNIWREGHCEDSTEAKADRCIMKKSENAKEEN